MQGTILNQRFLLDRPIRQGQSGVAYLATDVATGELLAVKVFSRGIEFGSEAGIRFRAALQRVQRFNHPHVATPHAFGIAHGHCYQVASYVPADPLDAVLSDGPLGLGDGIALLTQVAEGLAALHRGGVVHGGLVPRRIVVSRAGALRAVLLSPGRHLLIPEPAHAGPDGAFVAPEQAPWLDAVPDGRADLYALGILACRVFLGAEPFVSETEPDRARAHWQAAAARALGTAEALPRALRGIVQRLLPVEPECRYASAERLLADLTQFQEGGRSAGSAPQPAPAFLSRRVPEGTEAVRGAMAAALGRAASGHGGILAMHGWEGLGTETFLAAAVPAIEAAGALLLRGGWGDAPIGAPLSLARNWIADLANQWTQLPDARIAPVRLAFPGDRAAWAALAGPDPRTCGVRRRHFR
jgi:serine/threonine-protein kinase